MGSLAKSELTVEDADLAGLRDKVVVITGMLMAEICETGCSF